MSTTGGSGKQNEPWTKHFSLADDSQVCTECFMDSEPDPVPSSHWGPGRAAGSPRALLVLICRMKASKHSQRRGHHRTCPAGGLLRSTKATQTAQTFSSPHFLPLCDSWDAKILGSGKLRKHQAQQCETDAFGYVEPSGTFRGRQTMNP